MAAHPKPEDALRLCTEIERKKLRQVLAILARDAEVTPAEQLRIDLVRSLFSESPARALLIRALIADFLVIREG